MAEPPENYMVRNGLLFAFRALRQTDRLVNDSLRSPYENFVRDLADTLSPVKKLDISIPNSEVESFYNKRMSETEFMINVQTKILAKLSSQGGGGAATTPTGGGALASGSGHQGLLLSVVWGLLVSQNKQICSKLPNLSGKQMWEIFIKLDSENELKVHVDDLVDLILRIFQANGHKEQQESIKEWFCGEQRIDFWSFFTQLTEKFVGLLQIGIVHEIYTNIVCEILKEGKLEKKGHVVHNWKMRWFVLTASSLNYHESHESMILKGSVVINSNAVVQSMQEFKVRPYRFRVVCGETKNATEISAPTLKEMHDWMYTIKMAIKMHSMQGRNFLHKYRQASSTVTKPYTLQSTASEDRNNTASPTHKALSSSKSLPSELRELASPASAKQKQLPAIPDSESAEEKPHQKSSAVHDYEEYNDAPPLPPQRFTSSEVQSSPQVFDKHAFVEARRNSRARDKCRRHSSLEPAEVLHIESAGGDYALVNKTSPKKKKGKKADSDVSSLLSPAVRAQLPVDATEKFDNWEEDEKQDKPSSGYVQLHFHTNGSPQPKGKIVSERNGTKPVDRGKTKFGYSTVVFEAEKKESDVEKAEQLRQKKPVPQPPPKYEPSASGMPKHSSDSKLLRSGVKDVDYTEIDFSKTSQSSAKGASSPDLRQSRANGDGDESPYMNVQKGLPIGPPVPPRRGAAAVIDEDDTPPPPIRKIS